MKLVYSTGNAIVDQIAEINITGNVIPQIWFHTLANEAGKPMMLAINLLGDIVYWYKPREVRDENSGELIGFEKRFKADFLQRSNQQIARRFGVTKKQARLALEFLCEKGVIKKHLRNDKTADGKILYNNMYLELVPDRLKEITYPQSDEGSALEDIPYALQGTRVVPSKTQGCALGGTTNTENTHTQISNIDYNNPIDTMVDEVEVFNIYEQIIKENIEYEYLIQDNQGLDREKINEIVNLMVEIVAIKRQHITINGTRFPYEVVKGQLLKLNSEHVKYVVDSMKKNTTKIRNIRSYLLTALYNAPNTIDNYYQAEVNHDIYGGC